MLSLIPIPSLLRSSDCDVSDVNSKKHNRKYERSSGFHRYVESDHSDTSLNNDEAYLTSSTSEEFSPVESLLNPCTGVNTLVGSEIMTRTNRPKSISLNAQGAIHSSSPDTIKQDNGGKRHDGKCVTCPTCGMYIKPEP